MKLFDVYPRYDVEPVKGEDCWIFDQDGTKYLDLYGGHAVISIGHSHPHFVDKIQHQVAELGFYSNSVQMPIQDELALKLGRLSGYSDFNLFLSNSGAEANENAIKLASFVTGRAKVISFTGSFHGRTSLAVEATDNAKIVAPVNRSGHVSFLPFNDEESLNKIDESVGAVIIEGIQGIGGVQIPNPQFLALLRKKCSEVGALLILDEIQSGYGRSGRFFAHQHTEIFPDLITIAKGMGNGFPIGGLLISSQIKAEYGMLGTTFGGNHLACAAGIAVLDVIEQDGLIEKARVKGEFLMKGLKSINGINEVRGLGLMIGIDLNVPVKDIRATLLHDHKIFTGSAKNAKTLRLLPPLTIQIPQLEIFLETLSNVLKE